MTVAKVEVIQLGTKETKDHWLSPETRRDCPLEGPNSANALILDSWPSGLSERATSCSEPPGLW